MSALFGGDSPSPQPLPPDPAIAEEARRKREEAAALAVSDQRAAGRSSTMVAGMNIAAEEQAGRGLLAKARRTSAASAILG